MSNTIIVLVPGTTGSTLVGPNEKYDSQRPVWRYGIGLDLTSVDPQEADALAALERTDLRPGVLMGMATQAQGYYPFAAYFTKLGFKVTNAQYAGPGTPVPGWGLPTSPLPENLLVSFPYDWRQDCTASAKLLQQLLSAIDGLYASSGYQLFLVGHSMGGLVCRAYLENVGLADSWRANIQGLITLGTPHLGAPLALRAIMGQVKIKPPLLVSGPAIDTMIHNFVDTSFSDSSYELLPPPVLEGASQPPFTQYIQDGSEWYNLLDADLPSEITTAVTAAASQGLPSGATDEYAQNLQSAAAFFGTLNYTGTVSGSTPKLPPYYCVVGQSSANPTVTGFVYESTTQTLQPQAGTDGDEIVPQWSAAFTGRTVAGSYPANGVSHFALPGDPGVQEQVAAWIGVEPQQAHAVRETAAAAV